MRHKLVLRDTKKRSRIKKTEARRLAFKILQNSDFAWYPKTVHRAASYRNRCILTGRSRGVYNLYFRISRLMIRELASKGLLPGLKKASW